MLCAFFHKRLADANVVFSPFWPTVGSATEVVENGQWVLGPRVAARAALDGSKAALDLLVFRVNRLCQLLSLSDCWPCSIARHLAYWLDTHMHLVLACEKRESGPVRQTAQEGGTMYLYDWRYIPTEVTSALCLALGGGCATFEKGTSLFRLTSLFTRCVNNMSVNKTLASVFSANENDTIIKKTICCAVTRCLLGGFAGCRASFTVRHAVHSLAAKGVNDYFKVITRAVESQQRPTVLLCLREYAVLCVSQDLSLCTFLKASTKWALYANNVLATTDSLRTVLMSHYPRADTPCLLWWLSTEDAPLFVHFCRHAKRVPGITSRTAAGRNISVSVATNTIRRYRDRRRAEKAIATESFFDPDGVGTRGLRFFRTIAPGAPLSAHYVREMLGSTEAAAAFLSILAAMKRGAPHLRVMLTAPPPLFERAADCLELVRHSHDSRRYRLPAAYTALQLTALTTRFKDTSCERDEIVQRTVLICCTACSTIKNFVVGAPKKNQNADVSHGYKRVCHDGAHLLCDEKRLYRCCKRVPLKCNSFFDGDGGSYVLELFGSAYTITTCCGHVALLDKTHTAVGSPITCQRCLDVRVDALKEVAVHVRCCCFCEVSVVRKKGSFTGIFTDENEKQVQKTFCKRHARAFMKRENEPMDLAEVMREIPKRLRL